MQLELTLKPKVTDTLLCHVHAHKHFHAKHNICSEYVNGAFAHQGFWTRETVGRVAWDDASNIVLVARETVEGRLG